MFNWINDLSIYINNNHTNSRKLKNLTVNEISKFFFIWFVFFSFAQMSFEFPIEWAEMNSCLLFERYVLNNTAPISDNRKNLLSNNNNNNSCITFFSESLQNQSLFRRKELKRIFHNAFIQKITTRAKSSTKNYTKEMIGEWKRRWLFDFSFGETCKKESATITMERNVISMPEVDVDRKGVERIETRNLPARSFALHDVWERLRLFHR